MTTLESMKAAFMNLPKIKCDDPLTCHSVIMYCLSLGDERNKKGDIVGWNPSMLRIIASRASAMLAYYGVDDALPLYLEEYERAAKKHPGHTLDLESVPVRDKYWALAEEVGAVAAAMRYDNASDPGRNSVLIHEVTKVGALALAWLTLYQNAEDNADG